MAIRKQLIYSEVIDAELIFTYVNVKADSEEGKLNAPTKTTGNTDHAA